MLPGVSSWTKELNTLVYPERFFSKNELVKTWVIRSGKASDKTDELEQEIDLLEKKRRELEAELESLGQTILEKQNRLRELLDEQAKQDLLS